MVLVKPYAKCGAKNGPKPHCTANIPNFPKLIHKNILTIIIKIQLTIIINMFTILKNICQMNL